MVLIALALRIAVTPFSSIEGLLNPDHQHCWEQGNVARSLLAGNGFGSFLWSSQPSAVMPPVFPLIVAASFKIFGIHTPDSIFAVHAFNCAINALACIPIFLFTRQSFGHRAALWTAWAWVFSPYGIYFSAAWAWSTHLLLLCLCWMVYLAQKMEHSSRLRLWTGFGLLAGFGGLCEPTGLLVAAALMALALLRLMLAGKKWFLPGLVASLALAAAISPWIIRNALVFHRFIPMRDSMGLELWMGNNGNNLHWTSDDHHPLHDMAELADYERMGELAYMDHKAALAKAYIQSHPSWYVGMCIRRAVYIWTGFWSFDQRYLTMEPMDLYNIPYATALSLLAFTGLYFTFRHRRWEAMRYGAVLLIMPALYYFSHPEPYHLRALDPMLQMLGCYAILCWQRNAAILPAPEAIPASSIAVGD